MKPNVADALVKRRYDTVLLPMLLVTRQYYYGCTSVVLYVAAHRCGPQRQEPGVSTVAARHAGEYFTIDLGLL